MRMRFVGRYTGGPSGTFGKGTASVFVVVGEVAGGAGSVATHIHASGDYVQRKNTIG